MTGAGMLLRMCEGMRDPQQPPAPLASARARLLRQFSRCEERVVSADEQSAAATDAHTHQQVSEVQHLSGTEASPTVPSLGPLLG